MNQREAFASNKTTVLLLLQLRSGDVNCLFNTMAFNCDFQNAIGEVVKRTRRQEDILGCHQLMINWCSTLLMEKITILSRSINAIEIKCTNALKRSYILRRVLWTFGLKWLSTENPPNLPWVWRISCIILSTLQDYRAFSLLPPSLNDFPFHHDLEKVPGETISE